MEFEDQPWLPHGLRGLVTHALRQMNDAIDAYSNVTPLLLRLVEPLSSPRIIDICSGSGGPWPRLWPTLRKEVPDMTLELSDAFPNPASVASWVERERGVNYCETAVDASNVPGDLVGARTIFTGLHHFQPDAATRVLADAVAARAPIGAFEFTRRSPANVVFGGLAAGLALPLFVPFLRPFHWSYLFWTYLFPLGPLVYAWDAAVSNLRTYTPRELDELAKSADPEQTFEWESGELKTSHGPAPITYLVGLPG